MSAALRVILLVASALTCIYVARKLRKSQIQIMDTVYWIVLSGVLIILSIFPQLATWCSKWMGFQAPVNFIFMLMIFLLLLRVFLLSIRMSQQEDKLRNLVEELAIRDTINNQEAKKRDAKYEQ